MEKYFIESKRIAKDMLKESHKEYLRYKAGDGIIFLQQAGEKLFNAFSKYLEIKYSKQLFKHNLTRKYASYNQSDDYLMKIVDLLHRFFYHGESFEDTQRDDIEKEYLIAHQKIQSKINNL